MTRMIARTSGGKIRVLRRDQTFPSDGPVTDTSEPMPGKEAPWVAISTALLSPFAAWLLERLNARRGRRASGNPPEGLDLRGPDKGTTSRITVRTCDERLSIKLGGAQKASACSVAMAVRPTTESEDCEPSHKALSISRHLVSLMEIRSESGFRPDEDDVEIVYALSGALPNLPDTLHTLSSDAVVEEASRNHILSCVRGMIEHIRQERANAIGMIVEIHTHPQSSSRPSEQDRRYFASAARTVQTLVPNAQVLFGVHAISSEAIRTKREPVQISMNTIVWSSINREHEIAFYSADTQPYDVQIVD